MSTNSVGTLVGTRALVTGGSRGIGASIVRRLATDGAHVAFTFRTARTATDRLCDEVAKSGGTAFAIAADSANPEEAGPAVERAIAVLGGLDVLVNNVGGGLVASIDEYTQEMFDEMLKLNLSGTFAYIHHTLPHLGRGARIINIGSINADRVQAPGLAIYAMTKGAIAALTRGMARDLGPRGITVNNIQPGPISTDANPEFGDHADLSRSIMALGRYGAPHEVANVVSFLAGPDAAFVTGASWNVDGGFAV